MKEPYTTPKGNNHDNQILSSESEDSPSSLPSTSLTERTPVVIRHNPTGIEIEDDSIYYYFEPDYSSFPDVLDVSINPLKSIYRPIEPASLEAALGELNQEESYEHAGDIITAFLLSEKSVELSDTELESTIYEGYRGAYGNHVLHDVSIQTTERDGMHYRVVSFYRFTPKANEYITCIQMWDDQHIWAQPLFGPCRVELYGNIVLTTDYLGLTE